MPRVIDPEGAHAAAIWQLVDFTDKRVLEVGAGEGRLTWSYASTAAFVLATEPDPERIEVARRDLPAELSDRVELRVAAAEELDVPPHSFDLVFLSWSL